MGFVIFSPLTIVFVTTGAAVDVKRMYSVMRGSIEETNVSAAKFLETLIKDSERTVWIVNGELYADTNFVQENMKHNLHLRMMRSILKEGNSSELERLRSRRTAYTFHSSSTGVDRCPRTPVFVIAKRHGPKQCGTMIPNPYFGDLFGEWDPEVTRLRRVGEREWKQRDNRVFWRGKVRGGDDEKPECSRNAGNFARVSACALSLKRPDLFDVKTNSCRPQKYEKCDQYFHYDANEKLAISNDCSAVDGPYLKHDDFAKYQYLLDLPGSTASSYSRNLNHLWLFGSVVSLWDGPLLEPHGGASQWYTPALLENHTHVVINRDTAVSIVERIAKNDTEREHLRFNARSVADDILCPNCISDYILTTFAELRTRVWQPTGIDRLLNDPLLLRDRIDIFKNTGVCDKLNLVKVVASHTPHHRHHRSWAVQTAPLNISACDFLAGHFSSMNLSSTTNRRRRHFRR